MHLSSALYIITRAHLLQWIYYVFTNCKLSFKHRFAWDSYEEEKWLDAFPNRSEAVHECTPGYVYDKLCIHVELSSGRSPVDFFIDTIEVLSNDSRFFQLLVSYMYRPMHIAHKPIYLPFALQLICASAQSSLVTCIMQSSWHRYVHVPVQGAAERPQRFETAIKIKLIRCTRKICISEKFMLCHFVTLCFEIKMTKVK